MSKKRVKEKSFWQFGLVNGKLAEVHFDNRKIRGFCYVKASEYKTKQEKRWIVADTKELQLTYRKGVFCDKLSGKIVPEAPPYDIKKEKLIGPFHTAKELRSYLGNL